MNNRPTVSALKSSPWLVWPKPNPLATVRLFCFHYAGGTALFCRTWPDRLPRSIEVCGIQLPARGDRLRERPVSRLTDLIGDIVNAIRPYLDKPFAFFGHSMGALVGFEIARELRRSMNISPHHLFVSGRRAPQMPENTPPLHDLPEEEFIEELRRLNGTPQEVLDHPELMELMIPILRADFSVCETYAYTQEPPLSCSISAYGGLHDLGIPVSDVKTWREQTSSEFTLSMFPGDHFFLKLSEAMLLRTLAQELYFIAARLQIEP